LLETPMLFYLIEEFVMKKIIIPNYS